MKRKWLAPVAPARLARALPWFILALASTSVLAQRGRVELGNMNSAALEGNLLGDPANRPYQVYLPPSYDSTTNRYPAVYVLHGYTQDETALVGSMRGSLDSWIPQRRIGEMIAVFVNGANRLRGSFYLSSPVIGDYESYITSELVRLIDDRYRTLSSRESRGITGFSMGAWGAMHLAFKFPDTFSVAVAQSGLYDSRGTFNDGLARQFASYHPTNLAQFANVPLPANSIAAMFAGLAPNPERPALFADYPYENMNGQPVLVDSVHQLALNGDVQNGDLQRYLEQPVRLSGIKVVHGSSDSLIPATEAHRFTNALATVGLDFEYEEHPGRHEFRPDLALPFLSTHLRGVELYVVPPQLTLIYATNTVQVTFPTQSGVVYGIESSHGLRASTDTWSENALIIGNGQAFMTEVPLTSEHQFFRVRASNAAAESQR